MSSEDIKPYIPFYKRPPNKFVEYQEREFQTSHGGWGIERVAIFTTRSGATCEETAQVLWRYNPITGEGMRKVDIAQAEWLAANLAAVEEAQTYITKKGDFNPPLGKSWPKWEALRKIADEKWFVYYKLLKALNESE